MNGKFNAISIDNSPGLSIIVDSIVSSLDVIRCGKFALQVSLLIKSIQCVPILLICPQVLGSIPTILLDQVDGATVYLSAESLDAEILTSKCTAVNINVPPQTDEDDYRECPLPEQIRSYVRDGKIVSEIVEHAG